MIYFILNPRNQLIKIGYTAGLGKRLSALQTGSAEKLEVLGIIKGTLADEGRLHDRFDAKRVRGEWFKITELEAMQIIKRGEYPAIADGQRELKFPCALGELRDVCSIQDDEAPATREEMKAYWKGFWSRNMDWAIRLYSHKGGNSIAREVLNELAQSYQRT